jgi:hypothetical protein
MNQDLCRRALFAAIVLSALGAILSAQEPTFAIKVDVPLVSLDVSVKAGSKAVQGLSKEDFQLYEDGQLQDIKHFTADRDPIKLLAFLPSPLSAGGAANPDLMTQFADKLFGVMVTRKWPPSIPSPGNHFTYGQLKTAVERMRAVPGRKGILIVVDVISPDAEPDQAFDELLQLVRESAIPLYFIHNDLKYERGRDRFARLQVLAETSGGRMFAMPVVVGQNGGGMEMAARFIRELASSLYTVSYSPANPTDGKAHKIEIRLSEQRMSNLNNQKISIWQSRDQYSGK